LQTKIEQMPFLSLMLVVNMELRVCLYADTLNKEQSSAACNNLTQLC